MCCDFEVTSFCPVGIQTTEDAGVAVAVDPGTGQIVQPCLFQWNGQAFAEVGDE